MESSVQCFGFNSAGSESENTEKTEHLLLFEVNYQSLLS